MVLVLAVAGCAGSGGSTADDDVADRDSIDARVEEQRELLETFEVPQGYRRSIVEPEGIHLDDACLDAAEVAREAGNEGLSTLPECPGSDWVDAALILVPDVGGAEVECGDPAMDGGWPDLEDHEPRFVPDLGEVVDCERVGVVDGIPVRVQIYQGPSPTTPTTAVNLLRVTAEGER